MMVVNQLSGLLYHPAFQQWISPVGLIEG